MTQLERHHRSGLKFDWIVLREIRFEDDLDTGGRSEMSDLQANVDIKTWVSDDKRQCRTYVRVTIVPTADAQTPFRSLAAAVEGQFTVEGETEPSVSVEEFVRKQAPAILFPFVRQAIASATSGTRFGQILVPPINVVALVSDAAKTEQPQRGG